MTDNKEQRVISAHMAMKAKMNKMGKKEIRVAVEKREIEAPTEKREIWRKGKSRHRRRKGR